MSQKFRLVLLPGNSQGLQWLQQAWAWCLMVIEPDSSKSPTKFIIYKFSCQKPVSRDAVGRPLGENKPNPQMFPPHGDGENSWEETPRVLMKGRRKNFTFLREFSQFDTACGDCDLLFPILLGELAGFSSRVLLRRTP